MDNNILESLKGKSREERIAYLNANKDSFCALSEDDLSKVSGGGTPSEDQNPNSSGIDRNGNYISSWGYVCKKYNWKC